jgi:hypothetical protein
MTIDRAALQALTSAWGQQKSDYDDSENRYRINYNTALEDMRRQRERNVGGLNVGMADRGLQQSGIAAQEQVKLGQENAINQQRLAQNQTLNLGTLARKRLLADEAYNAQAPLL